MIPEYNNKSLAIGIPGIILQLGCWVLPNLLIGPGGRLSAAVAWLIILGMLAGSAMVVIGLGYYAKGKGYSAVLGLLGLLSCLGLLILAVLPDKMKNYGQDQGENPGSNQP